MLKGWIGVDLDGTLAEYDYWRGEQHIGRPIPVMVERVREWLSEKQEVRIFTARAYNCDVEPIKKWCLTHIGRVLPITCVKDPEMIELWDDRAVQVIRNKGITLQELAVKI